MLMHKAANMAAKQDALSTQDWTDEDLEKLAAFALSMKGKKLTHNDYVVMQEINANYGMYISAMHSRKMVEEIVTHYKSIIHAALHARVQEPTPFLGGIVDPLKIRAWLLGYLSDFSVADYDKPSELVKRHVIGANVMKDIQVQVTASAADMVEVVFINAMDQRPETRQVGFKLKNTDPEKMKAPIIADAVVKFVLSLVLFQQHGRLVRYN